MPAVSSSLNWPTDVAVDAHNNIYIADPENNRVRMVSPAGIISTFARTGAPESGGDGGPAEEAQLYNPAHLAMDAAGSLYIAEVYGNRIRKVDPNGVISTVTSAISVPSGLAIDAGGTLYASQFVLYRIWKIPQGGVASGQRPTATVIAGTGKQGLEGDDGPALAAQLASPSGLAVDASGNILFVDRRVESYVRKLQPANIFPRGVVNSATAQSGFLAPGELVTIHWADLGQPVPTTANLANGKYPLELSGVQVKFDGTPAPLLSVGLGQADTIVPAALNGRNGTLVEIQVGNQESNTIAKPVTAATPGLFTADGSGSGRAAILNADGSVNSSQNPAARGATISLFGTGAGQTSPPAGDGTVVQGSGRISLPVRAQIDGVDAEVTYAGAAPGQVEGVFQVNAVIPQAVQPGSSVRLRVSVGGLWTQPGVTVAIRSLRWPFISSSRCDVFDPGKRKEETRPFPKL
jgi:uncharacterized protein (TIGR03437 family)